MLKINLFIFLVVFQWAAFAQQKSTPIELYLHREINGVTEIIDTSFESKAAMHDFLKSLPPADLNVKNHPHVRIYRFDEPGGKLYFDRQLRLADSLLKKSYSYDFHTDVFDCDSMFFRFKIDSANQVLKGSIFGFPDSAFTYFFRNQFSDEGQSRLLYPRAKGVRERAEKMKKYIQLQTFEEADKKVMEDELRQKLTASNPPLRLEELKVFPNPGDGLVQLSFRVKDKATLKVRVLNATGQAIFSETTPGVSGLYLTEIDLRNAGKGVYYIYVLHGKKSAVRKLIIN